jgi:hypothetical protein
VANTFTFTVGYSEEFAPMLDAFRRLVHQDRSTVSATVRDLIRGYVDAYPQVDDEMVAGD